MAEAKTKTKTFVNGVTVTDHAKELTGALSGKKIVLPDDVSGYPLSKPFFKDKDGNLKEEALEVAPGEPDQTSQRLKLGLFIPSTNTAMEAELWGMIARNSETLGGVGIHTVNVKTAKPAVATKAEVEEYGRQFLAGLRTALELSLMAMPQYLIMGMSLEHVLDEMDAIKKPLDELQKDAGGLGLATWHEAVKAGLDKFGAKKIGVLNPFDPTGDANARKMFETLGYKVVRSCGMNCATTLDICHIPDWAKEKAIDYLANGQGDDNEKIDAIVQCGTNCSLVQVTEKVEGRIGIPVLGINQTLFWYSLRECGVNDKLVGCGRLLREH